MNAAVLAARREREREKDVEQRRRENDNWHKDEVGRMLKRCRCRGCIREDERGPNVMDGNIRPQRLGFDSGPAPRCALLF